MTAMRGMESLIGAGPRRPLQSRARNPVFKALRRNFRANRHGRARPRVSLPGVRGLPRAGEPARPGAVVGHGIDVFKGLRPNFGERKPPTVSVRVPSRGAGVRGPSSLPGFARARVTRG